MNKMVCFWFDFGLVFVLLGQKVRLFGLVLYTSLCIKPTNQPNQPTE